MNNKTYSVVKVFDKRSCMWYSDREYNEMTVKNCLEDSFELLKRKGYLFLNDVYQILGFPLTKEGQMYGWIYNGITEFDMPYTTKYSNSKDSIYITFECMENILDALPSEEEL